MNPPPQVGDYFKIYSRSLAASGKVKKVNRVNLIYESLYDVGNVSQLMTLKLPLHHWQSAKVFRDGKIITTE